MKEKNLNISPSISKRVKQLIKSAKNNKLVKPLDRAFKDAPVKLENHKGQVDYFFK